MATSLTAPAAPADLSSAIDALPVVGTEPSSPVDTPTETVDAPTPVEAPEPEAADADEDAPPEPEELDPADPLDADKISPDGKTYFFRKAKAQALLAARDTWNQVQERIPNATPEMLAENFDRAVGFDNMRADCASGDPVRIGEAVEFLMGTAAQNPQSIGVFADHIVANVARSHPQVFEQISGKILNGRVSSMYSEAMRSGDEGLFKLAQNLDYKLTGKFRTAEDVAKRDPLADDRAQLERERNQFNSTRQQEQRQRSDQMVAEVRSAADASIGEEITKSISAIADSIKSVPGGEIHLRHIIRDLNDAVEAAKKANPTWVRQYDLAIDRFRANPSAESKDQPVTMMRQFAAPIIAKQRNAVVKAVTGRILGQNAAAHAKQQQIATMREPGGSNVPVRRGGVDQKLAEVKQRGGTFDEGFKAVFG